DRAAGHGQRELSHWIYGDRPVMGHELEPITVASKDCRILRTAETDRASRHRIQHRLDVRGGTSDDPQDLTGRRLLGERLAQGGCDLGIRWHIGAARSSRPERRGALQTELRLWRVVLLASRAFHAHSPRAGRGSGLATIAWRRRWVKSRGWGLDAGLSLH